MTDQETRSEKQWRLKPTRMHQGPARIRYWYVIPEVGTPYEALFEPEYWAARHKDFAIGDMVRIEPDEGNYTADLRVMSTGIGGVVVQEYYKKEWAGSEAPESLLDFFEVKFAGPHHKFRIQRKADKHVVHKGFENEAAANRWMTANEEQLRRNKPEAA